MNKLNYAWFNLTCYHALPRHFPGNLQFFSFLVVYFPTPGHPKRSLKNKLLTIHQKNSNRVLDTVIRIYRRHSEVRKSPYKILRKGRGNRGNLGRDQTQKLRGRKRKLQSQVKLGRRKGTVTTENNLLTIQPVFIQKYQFHSARIEHTIAFKNTRLRNHSKHLTNNRQQK